MNTTIPLWARELKEAFCSGSVSQFILYGNIFDLVPYTKPDGTGRIAPLKEFFEDVMLEGYDAVIHYDRGKGIRITRGDSEWSGWLSSAGYKQLSIPGAGFRSAESSLDLIDRYILYTLNLQCLKRNEKEDVGYKLAVIIDFAQFIVPVGDPVHFAGELGSNCVKMLSWANDPSVLNSNIVTILITEKLNDLNKLIVENPHSAKIEIRLPDEKDMLEYIQWLRENPFKKLEAESDIDISVMAKRLTGLSRVEAQNVVSIALNNGQRITEPLLRKKKKEIIEEECQDLLEFLESPYSLDYVAGHDPVKEWLRQRMHS